jgi:hypothetical protein
MIKTLILLLFFTVSVWPIEKVCKTDTLKLIQLKSIGEMSDGEYRIFDECLRKCGKCNPCEDKYILKMKNKNIKEMNNNEYDYFSEHFWDCDSIKPCELIQFIEIKDKKEIEMTNNELDFYNKAKDECISYQDNLHRHYRPMFIVLMSLAGLGLALIGIGVYYMPMHH